MTKFNRNVRRRIQLSIAAAAAIAAFELRPAQANTYYWDTNGAAAGFGTTTATWSGSSADWSTDSTGGSAPASATTATTDSLNFGTNLAGFTGSVTVGTVNAGNITFGSASGAVTLNSGTITLAGSDTITLNNSADTINSVLAGTGSNLTVAGSGTLTLGGINTYTGTTTISGGASLLFTAGSTTTNTYGSLSYNIVGASTLEFNATGARADFSGVTFAFDSTGGGTFNTGSGNFVFEGNNTFTTNGGAQDTLSGSGGLNLGGFGAIFNVAKGANSTADLVVSTLLWNTSATTSVQKNGAGTMELTYAETYTGGTAINGGTLIVGNGSTGSLSGTTGTALTFGGTGTFNDDEASSSGKGMGALTFSAGDGTVQSTFVGTSAKLTFASLAARPVGATENFVINGGAATTNKIVLTSSTNAPLPSGSANPGIFFGGSSYAFYDTGLNYFRAVIYGTDASTLPVITTGATIGTTTASNDIEITGAITAQPAASVNTLLDSGSNNIAMASGTLSLNGILQTGGSSTISGGTGITTTASGNELVIRTNSVTDSLTISTPILANGTNAVTVSGAGTLTLSSTASTYTGVTYLNGGITNIAGDTSLGVAPGSVTANQLTFNGGTLQLNSAFNLATDRGITINAGGGTIDTQSYSSTYAGIVAGSGALTKVGAGSLVLSGANTYSGGTTISTGTLNLTYNGVSTLSALGTGPVVNNGTLNFGDSSSNSSTGYTSGNVLAAGNSLTGTGTLTGSVGYGTIGILGSVNQASVSLTSTWNTATLGQYGNAYSAAINLFNNVTTTGNQTYTGVVCIAGAPLNGSANPTTTLTATGSGSTIAITGGVVSGVGSYWSAGTLNINTNNGAVSLGGASLNYGVGNLNVNSGTATTTLTGGTYGYDYSIFSSNVALTANSNFQANQSEHISGLQFLGSVTGSAYTLTVGFTGGAAASSGTGISGLYFTPPSSTAATASVIIAAGSSGLTMNGAGSLTLSGVNTYTGVTTIDNGTLIAGGNAPASGNGVFGGSAGGTVALGDATTLSSNFSPSLLINGAFTVGRAITVGSATTATTGVYTLGGSNTSGTATYSGSITLNQPVTLVEATGGTVVFSTGTWTTANKVITVGSSGNTGTVEISNSLVTTGGININYGTLLLGTANALGGSTTPVTIAGGTLDLNHLADTVGAFTMTSGTVQSTGGTNTLTAGSYALQGGTIASGATLGNATTNTVTVSGGTTILTGTEAGTAVNINSGTLQLGSNSVLAGGGTVTLGLAASSNVGTLDLNGTSQSITTVVTTGNVPGSQIITSSTSGAVLTLTGNTAFAGQINGGANLGLTFNSSGNNLTLTGTSAYSGATNISAGTLNLNGGVLGNTAVTISSGATLAGTGNGSSTGKIGGTLAAAGGSTISLTGGIASTALLVNTGITLGGSGTYGSGQYTTLTYTLGASNAVEELITPGTMTLNSGGAFINITNPTNSGTYTLATYASPLAGSGGFSLSSTSANDHSVTVGRSQDTLTVGSTALTLTVTGASVPTIAYWDGKESSTWNDTTTSGTYVNWSSDPGGSYADDTGNTPGDITDVFLNGSTNGAGPYAMMKLGASTTINSLNVTGYGIDTIVSDGSTLTINALADSSISGGSAVNISGAQPFEIDTPIVMGNSGGAGADQYWTNGGSNTFTLGVAGAGTTISGTALAGYIQNLYISNTSTGATIINDVIADGSAGGKLALTIYDDAAGVTLAGVNTYTGSTTFNSGAIVTLTGTLGGGTLGGTAITTNATFNETSGIIAGTSSLSVTNGTTSLGGTNTYIGATSVGSSGTLDLTGTIGASGGGSAISSAGTFTETTGVIAGTSSLSVTGGTTSLGGTNTYTGTTGISSGGTLSLTGTIGSSGGSAISSAGTFTETTGVITGTSSLSVTGGTTSLAGSNTYTGTTTVSGGTLSLTGTLGSSPGHTAISSAATFNESSAGVIAGTSSVAVTGGTTTLAGNNTYSGGTSISAGTLLINAAGTSSSNSAIGTGTLTITGGTINNTSGSAIILATNNAQAWNGNFAFTGSSNLNLGTGTVTTGAATTTTVNGGTLTVGGTFNGTGYQAIVAGAGTLSFTGALNTQLYINGGTVTSSGGGTLSQFYIGNGSAGQTSTFTQSAGTLSLTTGSNTFSNANASGTAIWNMSGGIANGGSGSANWYGDNVAGSSTTYNWSGGTVNWTSNGFLVTARGTGTMNLTGTAFNVGNLSLGLWTGDTSTNVVNLDAGSVLSAGYIGEVTTSGFTPGSESAVTSTFNFNGGQLSPRGNVTNFLQYVDTVNIQNGGAYINTAGYSITIPSVLKHYSGATTDALTKSGAGTLTLTAANTYQGGTTVSTGTLLINNTSSSGTGTGPVTVSSGATLGGSGFISGATTVSGTIAAGATSTTIGTLTNTGGQTWNSGATYSWKLANTSGVAGTTGWDLIEMGTGIGTGGTLALDSTVGSYTLSITRSGTALSGGVTSGQTFVIADAASITGFVNNEFVISDPSNGAGGVYDTWSVTTQSGGDGTELVAIATTPEPGSLGLLGVAALGLLRRRRRACALFREA